MFWWILLGILVGILILPLGVSVAYDAEGVRLWIKAGFLRFLVFPLKKKEKKTKQETPVQEPQKEAREEASPVPAPEKPETSGKTPSKKNAKKPGEDTPGGSLLDFLPLAKLALDMVGELFGRTLHIDVLYLKLTMGGEDPCDLAVNYGKACTALGNLWPRLEELLTIKKRDIQLQCDFEAAVSRINARVDLSITLGRVLGLLIGYGVKIAWGWFKIINNRKKAAQAEKKRREKIINTRYSTKAVQDNES
jgi:hypothetical protein